MSLYTFQPISFDSDFTHIISGQKAVSPEYRTVINPANETVVASVPVAIPAQLDETINAAAKAFPRWAATPLAERQAAVKKLGQLLQQFREEFMVLLTKEQGKSLRTHSPWELDGAILWCNGIAAQSLHDEVAVDSSDRTVITRYTPLGVCAAIVPWNFPICLMIMKIAPALVTGNTVIVKPSPFTPLCNMKFVELAQQVLPAGVLSILSGDDNLGPWLTNHPRIAKISFTGSTATGKQVMKSAATSIKRITLELGGNDPAIVLPDVDAKILAPALFWAAFPNSGQLCAAAKRIYIHEDIYDSLLEELVAFTRTIKIGDGMDPTSDLGPVQNKMQYEKVKGFIKEAKVKGFKFAVGGEIPNGPGYFIPITIIDNPPETSRIVREEAFGPVVPLLKWRDDADVIRRANDTDYGLSASIWGKDLDRANRIAQKLEAGTVWINEVLQGHPDISSGGHKMSGLGVENGKAGLASWTNMHTVCMNRAAKL